jgi:hypothetical protein
VANSCRGCWGGPGGSRRFRASPSAGAYTYGFSAASGMTCGASEPAVSLPFRPSARMAIAAVHDGVKTQDSGARPTLSCLSIRWKPTSLRSRSPLSHTCYYVARSFVSRAGGAKESPLMGGSDGSEALRLSPIDINASPVLHTAPIPFVPSDDIGCYPDLTERDCLAKFEKRRNGGRQGCQTQTQRQLWAGSK